MDPRTPTADETELLEFVDKTGKTVQPLGPPGFWHDFGDGVGDAAMQGFSRVGRAAMMAGSAVPITQDAAIGLAIGTPTTALQDAYFRDVVDGLGTNAVDKWAPNAAHVGAAGQTLNGLVGSLVPLMVGGGNPAPLLATVGLDTSTDLVNQGAPLGTALGVAGINTAATAAGFKMPAAWGANLLTRMVTGAGANLAVGAISRDLSARTLEAGGEHMLAEQYGGDSTAALVDVGMGLAFGALSHAQAPRRISSNETAAILTASNAYHFREGTAPGIAADNASDAAHVQLMETAVRQMLNGEDVNVADAIPAAGLAFAPRAKPTTVAGYTAFRRALESGGRADAQSPTSSAMGIDQFTAGTWLRMVQTERPAWADGLSEAQILAARADPAKSGEMATALDRANAAALRGAGQEPTTENLYAAHHFGQAAGVAFAKADPETPVSQLLSATQIEANPYLRGMTKAQLVENWTRRAKRAGVRPDGSPVDTDPAGQALRRRLVEDPDQLMRDYAALEDSAGGTVLNTDTARELSPEYLADRTRSADVHEAASDTVKTIYERKLAAPTPEGFDRTVLFTAGGTGAGKTTAIRAMQGFDHPPEIVYDTNMNTLSSALDKVESALAANRNVSILYVYRDPVEALTGGALPRAEGQAKRFGTGRTVPLTEHAKTHIGVRTVMEALAKRYKGNPRVSIQAFDNSRGRDQGQFSELADLPKVEQNGLHERLQAALEAEHQAGRVSDATRRGFEAAGRDPQAVQPALVQSTGREPESQRAGQRPDELSGGLETPLAAAAKLAAATPDLSIVDGFDADGTPRFRPLADAMAERQHGAREQQAGDAYAAAANDAVRESPGLLVADKDGNIRPAEEVMREIEAAVAQADIEARAISTAVNCFLRTGS
jgi:hypothetical protein